jgi:hypothetical protein
MHGAFFRRGATLACYSKQWSRFAVLAMLLIFLLTGALILLPRLHAAHAQSDDWPTYQDDYGRSGFNSAETIFNPSSASNLKVHWSYKVAGAITTQPVEANGMIYWGSWDGFEHATNLDGTQAWQTNLSQTVDSSCHPPAAGVASTGAVASVLIGGTLTPVVFVGGGDATFYAFDRGAISNGPVWQATIAVSGGCPECGQGSISPSSWDGTALYVAGGHTTIGGNSCLGSLRALNQADGTPMWEDCLNDGAVLAAVSAVPGVAVVGEGTHLVVVATATGQVLFNFAAGKRFWGAASISNGVLYIGDVRGNLYAFGT